MSLNCDGVPVTLSTAVAQAATLPYLVRYAEFGIELLPLHSAPGGACSCGRPTAPSDRRALPGECESPGKHPHTRRGKDDASLDPHELARWLRRYRGCNWGGRPPVGQFVLDVDPRNGGDATLSTLELEHGPLLPTRTARTGSGGLHYWFAYDGPVLGKLGKGLDIKTHSGYLVLPPSVHACGGAYEWLDRSPVATAPEWMTIALTPREAVYTGGSGGIAGLIRFLAGVTEERNNRLYWAARRAVEDGLNPTLLRDTALYIGLTPEETDRTIASAARSLNGA